MQQVLGVGSEFAGFRIDEQLARGGMSEVYLAHHMRLDSKVVLKLLAPDLAEDETFRERFLRESRIAASLDHPNVIPIHDAGEFDGLPYIAMRYVQGPDLKELVRRDGPLPIERALSIVGQVASALDRAHASGLIHRDIKPGNILIDERDDEGRDHAYLTDFGVAKHTLSRSGLTSTGQFVGTIDYVAPEQIEGKPLDGRTDVYSLGCVLYEALTGCAPFERESNAALIYAHLLEPPPSLSERRPDLPAELDAVIATALAKSPEERYPNAKALVEAARAAVGAAPVTNGAGASGEAAAVLSAATLAAPPTEPAVTEARPAGEETLGPPETAAAERRDPGATRDVRAAAPPRPPRADVQPAAEPPSGPERPARRRRFISKPIAIAVGVLLAATAATAATATFMGSSGSDNRSRPAGNGPGSGAIQGEDDPYIQAQIRRAKKRAQARRVAEKKRRVEARKKARQKQAQVQGELRTARQRAEALQRQRAKARADALQRARARVAAQQQAEQQASDAQRRAEQLRQRVEYCRQLARQGKRC